MTLPENIALHCKKKLKLENTKLGDEYFYSSLPLCVIDAVFSISIKYGSVQNVLKRCGAYLKIKPFRENGSTFLPAAEQLSINDFLNLYEHNSLEYITNTIYKNRCRTSSKNGILKSEAVYRFLKVLQKYEVNYFQDMGKIIDNLAFYNDIISIPGQKSGLSLTYFFMLAGDENLIKPDRMVHRFIYDCTNEHMTSQLVINLLNNVIMILNEDYPNLTLRELDHEIWKYQRFLDKQ